MKHTTLASVAAIFLVIVIIGAAFYFDPSLLNQLSGNSNSWISCSVTNLAPQGSETSAGKWTGSFWTIAVTTDMTDQVDAIKFDNSTTSASGINKIGTFTIDPTATIEIYITPQQPYWTRSLNVAGYEVLPEVGQAVQSRGIGMPISWNNSTNVPEMSASVWTWGQSYWTAHTPFTITVTKNGQQWATQTYDNAGTSQTYTIANPSNSKEWISLKNIGFLSAGYGPPNLPDIAMLSQSVIYPYSSTLINDINYNSGSDYTYSNYWYGGGNYYTIASAYGTGKELLGSWGQPGFYNNKPAPLNIPVDLANNRARPGIYRSDTSNNYIANPEGPQDEWTNRIVNGQTYYGLNEYLNTMFTPLSNNQMDVYGSGWSITGQTATPQPGQYAGYVKEMMPNGAMSSLITIQISTDLADAIVERTPVGNGQITGMHWLGQDNGAAASIGDTSTLYVDVKQTSTVAGTIDLYATATAGQNIFLNPSSQKLMNLASGASQEVAIQVLNNGASSDQSGTLTVTLKNELGNVTDTKTIQYTLLTKGVGNTQLTVYVEDGKTNALVSGIPVAVGWGTDSKLETSGANGDGAFVVDLQGYTGSVTLTSTATQQYNSSSLTTNIGAGPNTATLLIYKYGESKSPSGLNWTLILIIAGIVAAVVVIGGVGYVASKKIPHRRKR